ncbi:MAG: DNA polymerase III subunit beta [Armatimonadota bacterium]
MLKAVVERGTLYEAAQVVARAVSGRSTLPVLNNLFVEGSDGQLRLVATDLELGIEATVEARVEEEGALTVPARIVTEVIANLPEADVELEVDESNTVSVKCARSNYSIRGLPSEEFSTLPELVDPITFELPQSLLRRVIQETSFASSPDETRPILTGALFTLGPEEMRVVATDTHRLALRQLPGLADIKESRSVIVPARVLNEVSRILQEGSEDPVEVRVTDTQIQFLADTTSLQSRLIEGQFPNYEKVVPESAERTIRVEVAAFQDALRRALIVAREDANRVVLAASEGLLTITADSQDVGRGQEEVEIDLEGEALEIAFNGRYLLDVLAVMEAENAEIELTGALNPGTIRPQDDANYTYVLMPMQIM